MNEEIIGQLRFVLLSLCLGMGCIACYDVLRFLRFLIPHGKSVIWVEDILYWSLASIPGFAVFFWFNQGSLRWYGVTAVIFGAWVYELGVSRVLRKWGNRIFLPQKQKLHRLLVHITLRCSLIREFFKKSQ